MVPNGPSQSEVMLGCLECTCAFGCNLQDPPLISPQPANILPQSSEILRRFVPLKYEREKVVQSTGRGFMNCMFSTCKTFGSTVLYSKYHLMYHEACLQWGQPDPPCQKCWSQGQSLLGIPGGPNMVCKPTCWNVATPVSCQLAINGSSEEVALPYAA